MRGNNRKKLNKELNKSFEIERKEFGNKIIGDLREEEGLDREIDFSIRE